MCVWICVYWMCVCAWVSFEYKRFRCKGIFYLELNNGSTVAMLLCWWNAKMCIKSQAICRPHTAQSNAKTSTKLSIGSSNDSYSLQIVAMLCCAMLRKRILWVGLMWRVVLLSRFFYCIRFATLNVSKIDVIVEKTESKNSFHRIHSMLSSIRHNCWQLHVMQWICVFVCFVVPSKWCV